MNQGAPAAAERGLGAVDHVRRAVAQWIDLGKFTSDELLPSAHELAKRLGVSRPMVLQGLKLLEAEGRVVIRPGAGTWVAPLADNNVAVRRAHVWQRRDEILETCVLREMIEVGVARELAGRGLDRRRLREARALNERLRAVVDAPGAYRRLDTEFHEVVTAGLPMPTVTTALMNARAVVSLTFDFLPWPADRREVSCDEHDRLLDVIANRDVQAAEEVTRSHVSASSALIRDMLTRDDALVTRKSRPVRGAI